MRIAKQRVTCANGHVADVDLVVDAPIAVCVASMQAAICPECGSSELGLGGSYSDNPPLSASIAERARWWRERGEIGTSSLTIWVAFTGGVSPHREHCYPHDPDDYRRCKLLLDLIPEWRAELGTVADRFPWFRPFIDRWDEFDRLYAEEAPKKMCPRLYGLMKVAKQEAKAIRAAGGTQ